jgi:hypothetical protein
MNANLTLKVTTIGKRHVAVLLNDGDKIDTMACSLKRDIGWICREMMRWFSKNGGVSKHAESARRRQTGKPAGKVWYAKDLGWSSRLGKPLFD